MAECIAVSNQKGGVGKSTTANAIGAGLFRRGKRVLYIDLDAQGNLSYSLGVGNEASLTSFDVLTGEATLEEAIVHTPQGDLLPFSPSLSKIDSILTETGKEYRLRDQLKAGQQKYAPGGGNVTFHPLSRCASVVSLEEPPSGANYSCSSNDWQQAAARNDCSPGGGNVTFHPLSRCASVVSLEEPPSGANYSCSSNDWQQAAARNDCPPGGEFKLRPKSLEEPPSGANHCVEPQVRLSGAKSLDGTSRSPASGWWDYIIIDTPPALGTLTVNALTACDSVIIPSQADIYSLQGVGQLIQTIQTVKKYCNNRLFIRGFLLVRYSSRTVISRDMTDLLEDTAHQLNTRLYKTKIRECVAIKESQAKHQDIFTYASKSNAAEDYDNLINEIFGEE